MVARDRSRRVSSGFLLSFFAHVAGIFLQLRLVGFAHKNELYNLSLTLTNSTAHSLLSLFENMSMVADNAVVVDDPISNGHQVHDGANSFEIPGKLVTDGEVVEAVLNGIQESALGAEVVAGAEDKTDGTLVTASSNDTLTAETFVEVLNVVCATLFHVVALV
jgi:hypothetical protein